MRWSVGELLSRRGAGLGNEVFPWAKAYLGARALGLQSVDPPWRLNSRRYDRELGTGSWDSVKYCALRAMPAHRVGAEALDVDSDYFVAMQALAPKLPHRKPVLLHTSGMAGGYLAIRRAAPYLRHSLLAAPDARKVLETQQADAPVSLRVGVHIRAGDFDSGDVVRPGLFNVALPLAWFESVLTSLQSRTTLPIEVFLASDTPTAQVREAATVAGRPPTMLGSNSVGDLAALTTCDLIVSSISSFSMLAIFLSDVPYVWHEPHLSEQGGWLSIWGHEDGVGGGSGATERSRSHIAIDGSTFGRGVALGYEPQWPTSFIQFLEMRAAQRDLRRDLLAYGVVRRHSP